MTSSVSGSFRTRRRSRRSVAAPRRTASPTRAPHIATPSIGSVRRTSSTRATAVARRSRRGQRHTDDRGRDVDALGNAAGAGLEDHGIGSGCGSRSMIGSRRGPTCSSGPRRVSRRRGGRPARPRSRRQLDVRLLCRRRRHPPRRRSRHPRTRPARVDGCPDTAGGAPRTSGRRQRFLHHPLDPPSLRAEALEGRGRHDRSARCSTRPRRRRGCSDERRSSRASERIDDPVERRRARGAVRELRLIAHADVWRSRITLPAPHPPRQRMRARAARRSGSR